MDKAAAKRDRLATRIRFGDAVVTARKPAKADVKRNAELMTAALQRVQSELTRPGVRLRRHKDVPLYFVAPDRPGVFIRVLNGKRDKGVLENGHFKVID